MVVYPREKHCDVRVNSGVVWFGAAAAPADHAVLPPVFVLLADQRTAAITATCVFSTFHVSGTQHVLGQRDTEVVVETLAFVPVDQRQNNLPQHVVVSRV